jgi:MFS family permease
VAPTLILLLLARFVQGASAAMLMPNSLAILALQLPFCFEVCALGGSLVGSTPE